MHIEQVKKQRNGEKTSSSLIYETRYHHNGSH